MKAKRNNTIYEAFGWSGVVLVIGSYGLLATGIVDGSSALYHSLVLVGALGVALVSYKKHDYQPAVLNTIFAVFALIALARIVLF